MPPFLTGLRARLFSLVLLTLLPMLALALYSDAQLSRNLLLLALAAALVAGIAWLDSEVFIVRPVRALVAATRRVSSGDLSARSGIPAGSGEIGQLAQAFDSMAATLEQRSLELNHTEQRYRTLLEQLPAIIWTVDHDLRLNAILGSRTSELGLTSSRFQGRTLNEIFQSDQLAPIEAHQRALAGESASYTLAVGEQMFSIQVEPLRDPGGQVIGAIGVASDTTETQRATAEAERRSHELALLNAVTVAAGGSLNAPRLLATLAEQLAEQMAVPAGAILVRDRATTQLIWEHTWGLAPAFARLAVASNQPPYSDVYSLSQPLLIEASAIPQLAALDSPVPTVWRSCMLVPLHIANRASALLLLLDQRPQAFDQAHQRFYSLFGNQIGAALRNAFLFDEVRAGRERLHLLSRRLVEVQESERREIARELHDEIGQTLTGLKLLLEIVQRLPSEQIAPNIEQARGLVNELMVRVRELSLDLRPAMLDDLGLVPALLWHIDRYTSQTQITVDFKHAGIDRRLPSEIETAAYRIIQEALTNIARYAETGTARVHIQLDHAVLQLTIEDHGRGFDPQAALAPANSSGLTGMHERASLLGGRLLIASTPSTGTKLLAELPLQGRLERRTKEQRDDDNSTGR